MRMSWAASAGKRVRLLNNDNDDIYSYHVMLHTKRGGEVGEVMRMLEYLRR
jgi:hypothetical protein